MLDAMPDQARGLRELFQSSDLPPGLTVLPMAIARRGMGFHSVVTNIAAGWARLGKRVIVLEGAAKSVSHTLGMRLQHDLSALLSGEREFDEIAVEVSAGLHLVKAQQGIAELAQAAADPADVYHALQCHEPAFDIAIVVGHVPHVAALTTSWEEMVFVTNPDDAALRATYAEMKRAHSEHGHNAFRILVNRVDDEQQGIAAFRRLADTTRRFIGVGIEYGGSLSRDAAFVAADRKQCTVFDIASAGSAATSISQLLRSMRSWHLGRYIARQ